MKSIKFLCLTFLLVACQSFSTVNDNTVSESKPISHDIFNSLLEKHVNSAGLVDYKSFIKDSIQFNKYLDLLSTHLPNEKNWSRDERLAYWINAYNAFTIKLIMNHYPVKSIKDIKKGIPMVSDTWTIDFIIIEGKKYNLNNIEHGIVRPKFNDPRVHFALNCASMGCPPLLNHAYTAEKLNVQLDSQAKRFINDGVHNKIISPNKANLSKIFSWFAIVSILLTATGLFALVSLTALKKMKEIALRKVVGASPHHILVLINKGYFWVFIVAAILGCYGGWALTKLLLDMIFTINIGVGTGSVIWSVVVLFIIAAVTSGIKVLQAVRTNPVKLLRTE